MSRTRTLAVAVDQTKEPTKDMQIEFVKAKVNAWHVGGGVGTVSINQSEPLSFMNLPDIPFVEGDELSFVVAVGDVLNIIITPMVA